MNDIVKMAQEMDQYNNNLPNVEQGGEVFLSDIWNGTGDMPQESFSYQLTDSDWINYEFIFIEKNSDPLKNVIRITNIELL